MSISFRIPPVILVILLAGVMYLLSVLTPSSALVRNGVYRFTRNPMYLGFLLVLAAWAAFLSSLMSVLALPCFIAYINKYQIEPEERALLAKFGAEFEQYAAAVRRWI